MIAAIYARKSTEQSGVADEQKSVARQIDHARRYAAAKGWMVAEDHIYVDDGISGAEFANRPGFLRLMNALKPRAPFQVLIMSEESRLGRESIEVGAMLKQIVQAGIRVFYYMDDRERTLNSPIEKVMMQLATFADELEREKARQRTYDAMARKARAGQVTGGRVFGYRNVDVFTDALGTDGRPKRGHVMREVDEAEAVVIRRIFDLCAQGVGMKMIAITLNDEGAPSPRSQQGRPRSWAPSSVREVLYRDLHRGVLVWNKTRKRDQWGLKNQQPRPESEWMRMDAPHLRIVSDEQWQAAHDRLATARQTYLRGTGGHLWGRPASGTAAKHLLTGFGRCGVCGGSLIVKSRAHGLKRLKRYACSSYHLRGRSVCGNKLEAPMEATDALVLDALQTDLLTPEVVTAAVDHALGIIAAQTAGQGSRLADTSAAVARLDEEIARLTSAIATGGDLDVLVTAVRERREARAALQAEADRIAPLEAQAIEPAQIKRQLRERLEEWRGLLGQQLPWTRQVLGKLLSGKIVLTPFIGEDGSPSFRVNLPFTLGPMIAGICPKGMASPAGFEPAF